MMIDGKVDLSATAAVVFLSNKGNFLGLDTQLYKTFSCDLSNINDKEIFLKEIANAMQFPSYFGVNWDAFDECLNDMSWLPAKGYILFIHNSRKAWAENPMLMGYLVSSWLDAADSWKNEGVLFKLVFV